MLENSDIDKKILNLVLNEALWVDNQVVAVGSVEYGMAWLHQVPFDPLPTEARLAETSMNGACCLRAKKASPNSEVATVIGGIVLTKGQLSNYLPRYFW